MFLFIVSMGSCVSIRSILFYKRVTQKYAESDRTYILKVPFIRQDDQSCCGRFSLAMVIGYWTGNVDLASEFAKFGICPINGFSGGELKNLAISKGFKAILFTGETSDIFKHLKATRPIIVLTGKEGTRHYVVVNGYSEIDKHIIFIDPDKGMLFQDIEEFYELWTQANRFALLIIPSE